MRPSSGENENSSFHVKPPISGEVIDVNMNKEETAGTIVCKAGPRFEVTRPATKIFVPEVIHSLAKTAKFAAHIVSVLQYVV